jgi:hypothetical protein
LYYLIEEVILNCYGEGEIYYDCSRMSPFCDNNIINYIASKEYFSAGVDSLRSQGWNVKVETAAESLIIPFVDAQRIFDQDIEVLV